MTNAETASFAEFAKIQGCSKSYVTALRKSGRLVLTDDEKRVRVTGFYAGDDIVEADGVAPA